jgi:hypothetical protein
VSTTEFQITADLSAQEAQLQQQLSEAEQTLAGLQSELNAIQADWDAVEDKRVQYEPLELACQSLENLSDEGLSRIFWGDRASEAEVAAHLTEVRAEIAELGNGLIEIEQRRESVKQTVREQMNTVSLIEGDLIQAIENEERRRHEWVVERQETAIVPRLQILPWSRRLEEDERFRKSLLGSAFACLLLGLIIPWIEIPIPDKEQAVEIPERFARLIRKEPVRPMPEARPIEQKTAEKPPQPEPDPEKIVEPDVKPESQVAEVLVPEVAPESPRDRVASTGLLAFRESFSDLANSRPSARLGAEAQISNSGETATGLPERSMVATDGPGSSGGINLSDLSRNVGSGAGAGDQIDGVQLSRVASSIGASGSNNRPLSSGAVAGRTDEEIQIVFDRYKAALYRLYNRELRKDPTLRGQIVLRLTIEPDGTVSVCQLNASDMDAPMLADQVVDRVLGFDFGAKDVPSITILYPIDFLPTA